MTSPLRKTNKSNQQLVKEIREGNEASFEKLFFDYYYDLCLVAVKITKSTEVARDVVQDVFFNIWEKRANWQVNVSLKAYLYQAVWNGAINYNARQKSREKAKAGYVKSDHSMELVAADLRPDTQKIVKRIWHIVDTMPERRRFVFTLHRKHGLTYKEISKVMSISCKTVENHMGLALKQIREEIDVPDSIR